MTEQIKQELDGYIASNEKKHASGKSKQCMNKQDMLRSLQAKGHQVSYSTVCRYVRSRVEERRERYIRQEMPPGHTAEFDWGHVKVEIGGREVRVLMAVFTLKHSCHRWARLYYREDGLSFSDAHIRYFEATGYVPKEVVFDNAKVMVKRHVVSNANKAPTDRLRALSIYYQYRHRFTNAYAGHEKGSVERSVEYVRRVAFSTRDSFEDLEQANAYLAVIVDQLNNKPPRGRKERASALFEAEQAYMLKAAAAYQAYEQHSSRVDKYGCITIDTNHYSVPDSYTGTMVEVRVYADRIEIYSAASSHLASHTRRYSQHQYYIQIAHYLHTLEKKPGALARSSALAQADEILRGLYNTYYQDDPKGFITLLLRQREKQWPIQEVVAAHTKCMAQCGLGKLSIDKIEILISHTAPSHDTSPTSASGHQDTAISKACQVQLDQVTSLMTNSKPALL